MLFNKKEKDKRKQYLVFKRNIYDENMVCQIKRDNPYKVKVETETYYVITCEDGLDTRFMKSVDSKWKVITVGDGESNCQN